MRGQGLPSRPPGRPRDLTREQGLLAAAVAILAERGFAALTVDEVAARAGSSKATVYRRWSHKEALVVDALTRLADDAVTIPDTGSLVEDLRELLHGMVVGLSGPGGELLRSLVAEVGRSAALTDLFREKFVESRRAVLAKIVRRAEQRSELADGVDVELLVEAGPALLVYRWLMTAVPADGQLVDHLVNGLVAPLVAAHSVTTP